MTAPRILHCWEDGPRPCPLCNEPYDPDRLDHGTTCFREADHAGPHEWTCDATVEVSFADVEPQS